MKTDWEKSRGAGVMVLGRQQEFYLRKSVFICG